MGYRTVSPVVENSETKILNDTYDNPVITSDTWNQDGDTASDVAYRKISPVFENSEAKILNYTYGNPVVTSDTWNQDGDTANDVANRTVSPVVENSETKMLNNTYSNPIISNQDANIANKARPQLNSHTTSGQYLEFSGKSTQPNSRSDNTKNQKRVPPDPRSLGSLD